MQPKLRTTGLSDVLTDPPVTDRTRTLRSGQRRCFPETEQVGMSRGSAERERQCPGEKVWCVNGRRGKAEAHKISQGLTTTGLASRFALQNTQPLAWYGTIRMGTWAPPRRLS